MNLQELKLKKPEELLKQAEKLSIEDASSLRKKDLMFAILKSLAKDGTTITGEGVLEKMQDGFGFLRSPESNYLPGPDDIYVSPSQIKKFSLRTGDSVEGEIRAPKQGERYFAITKINTINGKKTDDVKNVNIGLMDVDSAIMYYFTQVIMMVVVKHILTQVILIYNQIGFGLKEETEQMTITYLIQIEVLPNDYGQIRHHKKIQVTDQV